MTSAPKAQPSGHAAIPPHGRIPTQPARPRSAARAFAALLTPKLKATPPALRVANATKPTASGIHPPTTTSKPTHDESPRGRKVEKTFDPLDPSTRQAAQLAPPALAMTPMTDPTTPHANETVAPRARVSMEELLPQLVRRIAWAGDKRKGTMQLELGAGRYAGTVVTVHADDGRVRVELGGTGAEVDELRARIATRLQRQGVQVDSVT